MNELGGYVQLRDFHKALNADVVKKARARGTSPPWLKEFAGQLEDPEYVDLSLAERGFLHDLRLLALRRGNKILVDEHYLRVQLRCTPRTLCVPKVERLRALGFLEPYDPATNPAANNLIPSRNGLEHGENDSAVEVEGEVEGPPNPPEQGGSATSSQENPNGRRRARAPSIDPVERRRRFVDANGWRLPTDELEYQLDQMGADDSERIELLEHAADRRRGEVADTRAQADPAAGDEEPTFDG